MDVYITEKETGTRIALAMLPEKVKHKGSAKFQSYDIINVGEVKLPRGTKLLSFSWSGTFPGESRKSASFIKAHHWKAPKEMESIFERWRKNGTVLILMVTETWINHEVMVSDYTGTPTGGCGDVSYDVTFIESKEIKIYTTSELNIMPSAKTNENGTTATRPEPAAAAATTYTVKKGDNLWNIAKKFLGDGSRYKELYELNKDTICSNPNLIYPGQTFTLPA